MATARVMLLLRPRGQQLLDFRRGRMSVQQLSELEDRCILAALKLQQDVGIKNFSDGEFRRDFWLAAVSDEFFAGMENSGIDYPRHPYLKGKDIKDADYYVPLNPVANGKLALKKRITGRVQLNSDGLPQYVEAVVKVFRPGEIDHAEVIKTFASSKPVPGTSPNSAASRYSPGRMLTIEKRVAFGEPDEKHASTSFMERWNLTVRMQNRRFTRLTNCFSKKLENHAHMLALTMVYYNFCRKHMSLKGQTPAMAAGLTSYRWTVSDLLSLDLWWNEASAA